MGKLTDRDLAPSLDLNSLVHIVNTNDTTQNIDGSSYKATLSQLFTLFDDTLVTQDTGTLIRFDKRRIYNTVLSPETGNITTNITDAQLGMIQKIYHNDTVAPTFFNGITPWVLLGDGTYTPNTLNIIYAEWCGNNRVEYWITQPN